MYRSLVSTEVSVRNIRDCLTHKSLTLNDASPTLKSNQESKVHNGPRTQKQNKHSVVRPIYRFTAKPIAKMPECPYAFPKGSRTPAVIMFISQMLSYNSCLRSQISYLHAKVKEFATGVIEGREVADRLHL